MAEFHSGISDCLWRQKMPKSGALEMRLSHGVAGAFSVRFKALGLRTRAGHSHKGSSIVVFVAATFMYVNVPGPKPLIRWLAKCNFSHLLCSQYQMYQDPEDDGGTRDVIVHT